jgi:hypothetical protein
MGVLECEQRPRANEAYMYSFCDQLVQPLLAVSDYHRRGWTVIARGWCCCAMKRQGWEPGGWKISGASDKFGGR